MTKKPRKWLILISIKMSRLQDIKDGHLNLSMKKDIRKREKERILTYKIFIKKIDLYQLSRENTNIKEQRIQHILKTPHRMKIITKYLRTLNLQTIYQKKFKKWKTSFVDIH